MLLRLIYSVLFASCCLLAVKEVETASFQSSAPAQPRHGLTGSYYISTLETHSDTRPGDPWFVQVWYDPNDFELPRPFTAPAAVRVDQQIAFGNAKGFVMSNNKRFVWAPTGYATPAGWKDLKTKPWDYQGGAIWRGFIHLPKAGTYYLSTVSNGPSAVYLNKARVALNGVFGGVLVSDAFSYNKDDVRDYVQYVASGREDITLKARPGDNYVVPITINAARDLPIEVDYSSWVKANQGAGIDLFWVTPDSPHGTNGKPMAQIVPSEALYVDAPGELASPAARGANSTISADFLYFPTEYTDKSVTLTVRLADKDGNPVSGKRVYVNSLTSYGNADTIIQPEKPTDEQGTTTAKLRAAEGYKVTHDSTIFATDVTDLVDVTQVAHVTFQDVPNSFFPDSFSPYYDPHNPTVEPLPLRVGQPVTIKTTLENRAKFPAEVTATFFANNWNIGATSWREIAKFEHVALQPGEHKVLKTTWVPGEAQTHQCFKVDVSGRLLALALPANRSLVAAVLAATNLVNAAAQPLARSFVYASSKTADSYLAMQKPDEGPAWRRPEEPGPIPQPVPTPTPQSQQQNIGPVTPKTPGGYDKRYWAAVEERTKDVQGLVLGLGAAATGLKTGLEGAVTLSAGGTGGRVVLAGKSPILKKGAVVVFIMSGVVLGEMAVIGGIAHSIASDPPDSSFLEIYTPFNYELPPLTRTEGLPQAYAAALDAALRNQLEIISFSNAELVSLERYQGAKIAGNQEAANRQLVAYINYTSQVSQALERGAHLVENLVAARRASGLPDIEVKADQIQAAQQRLASSGFTDEQLAFAAWLGVSEEFLKDQILPAMINLDTRKAAGSYEQKLLELADVYRRAATGLTRKSSLTHVVGNPHGRPETIDLFIRPISIPADWKVTIVNAAPESTSGERTTGNNPSQFPMQEVEPGKHYAVRLPAKAQIEVESVMVPSGELGANTIARWAVEGKIGNELIGGMVQEMKVPYTLPDVEEAPAKPRSSAVLIASALGVLILVFFMFFLLWRRRQLRAAM